MKHLISLFDLTTEEVEKVLKVSEKLKRELKEGVSASAS